MKLDKRSFRRILLGVPLAAFVLAFFVSWGLVARERAHADFPHTGIDFSLTGTGGCSSDGSSTCVFAPGETFKINWVVAALPGGFTYNGYDTTITYSGLTAIQASLVQTAWTDCSLPGSKFTVGAVKTLCAISTVGSPSSYAGVMWSMIFQCPSTPGSGVISMLHGVNNTDLVDVETTFVAHGEAASGSESLTINCTAPTPTPVPPGQFAGTGTPGYSGDNGPAATAQLNLPGGVSEDASYLYIADTNNCAIRQVELTTQQHDPPQIHTVAGNGTCSYNGEFADARNAQLNHPRDVFLSGTDLYIADTGNCRVRKVANVASATPGPISTVSGGTCGSSAGSPDGSAASLIPSAPVSVAIDSSTTAIYTLQSNCQPTGCLSTDTCQLIRQVGTGSPVAVVGTTCGFAGDHGPGPFAKLNNPNDIAILHPSSVIVIADKDNNRIRTYDPTTTVVETIAGSGTPGSSGDGGLATDAKLDHPSAIDAFDYLIYIADTNNKRIRVVDMLHNTINTFIDETQAATGQLQLNPTGVIVNTNGTIQYCDSVQNTCKETHAPYHANSRGGTPGNYVPTSGCGLVPGVGTIDFALPAVLLGLIATRKRLGGLWRWFCALLPAGGRAHVLEKSGG